MIMLQSGTQIRGKETTMKGKNEKGGPHARRSHIERDCTLLGKGDGAVRRVREANNRGERRPPGGESHIRQDREKATANRLAKRLRLGEGGREIDLQCVSG